MATRESARFVEVRLRPLARRPYAVRVGPGAPAALAGSLLERPLGHCYALVADEGAHAAHGAGLEEALRERDLPFRVLLVEGGDASKSRARKQELEDTMLRLGLGRDACVLAFGGGATLDLAGFLAATYARGVPWVALPTTLLSMADTAVGGKTAVNTPQGKNLVGAFHHPASVLCDVAWLETLPERELGSGLAEVVKSALLEGEERLRWTEEAAPRLLAREARALEEAILFCVGLKARIVEEDDTEQGLRRLLNLGHTVGHAVEAASEGALLHGEAVSLGLVAEARLGASLGVGEAGLADRIEALLVRMGLPTRLPPEVPPRRVLPFLSRDKKSRAGRSRFVFLDAPGRPHEELGMPAAESAVLEVLEGLAGGPDPLP